jgi:hypothetical protein
MFRSLYDHHHGIYIFMFSLHCVLYTFLLFNLLVFFTGSYFVHCTYIRICLLRSSCVELFHCCTIEDFGCRVVFESSAVVGYVGVDVSFVGCSL